MRKPVSVFLALVAALAFVGCGSSGGGADLEPPAPVKKPFQPPTFDAAVFEHEAPAFTVHYPSDFQQQEAPDSLFTAASPAMVPRIDISLDTESEYDSPEELGSAVADVFAELGGGDATARSVERVTLQDGVTSAAEVVVDWSFQGFPLSSVVLLTPTSDGTVNVTVTGMEGGELDELREIAYTLYFE